MARPMRKPKIAPVSGPSSYATASTATSPMSGRDAVDPEVREQRRLQDDAHEDDEPEADATDHGTGTGGYLSTFTKVSASRSTTGRSSASRAIAPPASTVRTTVPIDEARRVRSDVARRG